MMKITEEKNCKSCGKYKEGDYKEGDLSGCEPHEGSPCDGPDYWKWIPKGGEKQSKYYIEKINNFMKQNMIYCDNCGRRITPEMEFNMSKWKNKIIPPITERLKIRCGEC